MENAEKAYEILMSMKGVASKDIMDALKAMAEWKDFQYAFEESPKNADSASTDDEESPITRDEFINTMKSHARRQIEERPYLRWGQSVFNAVDARWTEVARSVQFDRGIDCFYDDTKVDEFLNECYNFMVESGNYKGIDYEK